jgi:hypothetical protein
VHAEGVEAVREPSVLEGHARVKGGGVGSNHKGAWAAGSLEGGGGRGGGRRRGVGIRCHTSDTSRIPSGSCCRWWWRRRRCCGS